MLVDVVVRSEISTDAVEQLGFYLLGLGSSSFVHQLLHRGVLPTRQVVGHLRGQHLAEFVGNRVVVWSCNDIRRRTLHHRHVQRCCCHCRNKRYCCGSRTNHHNSLVCVVKVLGPLLRVNDGSRKTFATCEHWVVALFVAVVTRTHKQEVASDRSCCASLFMGRRHCPAGIGCRPLRFRDQLLVANVLVDRVFLCGVSQILQNRRPICNRLCLSPRFEAETERVHVTVGANSWITKKIPCSTEVVAPFENDIRAIRAHRLQVIPGANAREPRTDDDYINMLCAHQPTSTIGGHCGPAFQP